MQHYYVVKLGQFYTGCKSTTGHSCAEIAIKACREWLILLTHKQSMLVVTFEMISKTLIGGLLCCFLCPFKHIHAFYFTRSNKEQSKTCAATNLSELLFMQSHFRFCAILQKSFRIMLKYHSSYEIIVSIPSEILIHFQAFAPKQSAFSRVAWVNQPDVKRFIVFLIC